MPTMNDATALAVQVRALFSKLRRRLRDSHPGDFTSPQIVVLGHLARYGATTISDLARAEGIRPQSMRGNVEVLEKSGLLTRTPDPRDGRQILLSLTPAADEVVNLFRATQTDWLTSAIRARLTASEQRKLGKSLEMLMRVLDP